MIEGNLFCLILCDLRCAAALAGCRLGRNAWSDGSGAVSGLPGCGIGGNSGSAGLGSCPGL